MPAEDNEIHLMPAAESWIAQHVRDRPEGVASISLDGQELLRDSVFYIDELNRDNGIVSNFTVRKKAGCAFIESSGFFPFGGEPAYRQKWKYGQNHVQVTFDLQWPKEMALKRRFGLGSCFLPGCWKRFYAVPPAYHWNEGAAPGWTELPAPENEPVMIGHWHRPPLALVFENTDGKHLEVGTGTDLWRWERALEAAPESGSYKIFLRRDGIELVREPLMTCLPFKPVARNYRFKWYLAWSPSAERGWNKNTDFTIIPGSEESFTAMEKSARLDEGLSYLLDFSRTDWSPSCRCHCRQPDYIRGNPDNHCCWSSQAVKNTARKVVRRIKHRLPPGTLVIKGVAPALCWHPSHQDRDKRDGLPHWAINDLLDFSLWTRRHLGDAWEIYSTRDAGFLSELPSLRGLFQPTGF